MLSSLRREDFSLAQTGFLYRTGYYFHVAPLAQTGMTGADINAKAVAPGRAGRALHSTCPPLPYVLAHKLNAAPGVGRRE